MSEYDERQLGPERLRLQLLEHFGKLCQFERLLSEQEYTGTLADPLAQFSRTLANHRCKPVIDQQSRHRRTIAAHRSEDKDPFVWLANLHHDAA
jgi:hypothetical protein